jgi:hypothetical protein
MPAILSKARSGPGMVTDSAGDVAGEASAVCVADAWVGKTVGNRRQKATTTGCTRKEKRMAGVPLGVVGRLLNDPLDNPMHDMPAGFVDGTFNGGTNSTLMLSAAHALNFVSATISHHPPQAKSLLVGKIQGLNLCN